jgi:hypothetical protein
VLLQAALFLVVLVFAPKHGLLVARQQRRRHAGSLVDANATSDVPDEKRTPVLPS